MLMTSGNTKALTGLGKSGVKVDSSRGAGHDGTELDRSEIDGSEVDGIEFGDDKIGKKV